ncbi:MAG: MFS transporter [Candidatus Odinarchaeota archaeon]
MNELTPKTSLISAFLVHASVEIPFFIFPVIVLLVGNDLFQNLGAFKWIGLGSLGTIASLAAGLPSPFFGWLADRYRRGAMMFYSLIISALGALIIGFLGKSFIAMAAGVGLTGLGVSLYHPPGLSWVSTAYEDPVRQSYSSNYNRVLGIHGMGGTVGASIGPLSVYLLVDIINWRQIYILWAIPLVILAVGFWLFVGRYESRVEYFSSSPENLYTGNKANNMYLGNNRAVLVVFGFIFTMSLAGGMISFILSPFLSEVKKFKVSEAAFFVGFANLLGAIGQLIGGYLGDKFSEKFALLCSTTLQVGILVGIYIITQNFILFVFYIGLGMVTAIFMPATNSLLAKSAARRGSAFGWFMLISSVVRSLGPGIDGLLISVDPNDYLLIFSLAIFLSIGAVISLLLLKSTRAVIETTDNSTMRGI